MNQAAFEIYAAQLIELINIENNKFNALKKLLADYFDDDILTTEIMSNMIELTIELSITADRMHLLSNQLKNHSFTFKESLAKLAKEKAEAVKDKEALK